MGGMSCRVVRLLGLGEAEDGDLDEDHAAEHAEGIDSGVCYGGAVARESAVGIIQCHWICH